MSVNVAMWGTALRTLVKIDDRGQWESLDAVSKWLIATRSAVTTVTLYSCVIAGLLAWKTGTFAPVPWIVLTAGLFFAHGANNLLNDYTDYRRGIDNDNYFRTQYGAHPLVQKFWGPGTQLRWFAVSMVFAAGAIAYALVYTHFDPVVIGLVVYGLLMLTFYTYPLKYLAMGEITIFLIWGPVIIGGLFYVLTGRWDWTVTLAGVPFGLSTASINIGKHIDKSGEDKQKGVTTLPVLLGQTASRMVNMAVIVLAYLVTFYLVLVPRFFGPVMLIVLLAVPKAWKALQRLSKPRPAEAPPGYPIWPRWFSTLPFFHNRTFGLLFVIGVILDTALELIPATRGFWGAPG
jgi:1,4-dihydroxy-2-naphthoate polyprenyltransferase